MDKVNNRLFIAHHGPGRYDMYQLDRMNRIQDRDANWVLGQPDLHTSHILPGRSASSIKLPLAVQYDPPNQRLFVADGGHNRVLVFDVHPNRIRNGADAIAVIGQKDFWSVEGGLSANRWRRPGDMAYEENHQRLFVDVPWENRILMFNVSPEGLASKKDIKASVVIGQADFTSDKPGASRRKFQQPDGLAYDAKNDRLYASDKFNNRVLIFG